MATVTELLVTGVLSGGFGAALSALANWRLGSRKVRLEESVAPVHIGNTAMQGAEKAVLLLGLALDRAEREIEGLKRDRDEERIRSRAKDDRIAELEIDLAGLRTKLDDLQTRLSRVQNKAHEALAGDTGPISMS